MATDDPVYVGPVFVLVDTNSERIVAATHPDGSLVALAEALAAHWPSR
jgi:hypothetical protein